MVETVRIETDEEAEASIGLILSSVWFFVIFAGIDWVLQVVFSVQVSDIESLTTPLEKIVFIACVIVSGIMSYALRWVILIGVILAGLAWVGILLIKWILT